MNIKVEKICKKYEEKEILTDLSICFEENKVNVLMGPSGCGKTTLLNIMMGLEKEDSGFVEVDKSSMAVVFQEDRLCEDFSVYSNVKLTAADSFKDQDIQKLLIELGLENEINTKVAELSGGMKRRVAIARAIAADKKLLIMDEPFNGLDDKTKQLVADVLNKLQCTIIMVTHDTEDIEMMSGILYKMEHRKPVKT